MEYIVKYTRYCKQKAERRISGATFVTADNFAQACRIAHDRVNGMRDADPDREYEIATIDGITRGYHRAVDCEGGIHMFETREEFSERIKEEA